MDIYDEVEKLIKDCHVEKKKSGEIEISMVFKEDQTEEDCEKIKEFIYELADKTK